MEDKQGVIKRIQSLLSLSENPAATEAEALNAVMRVEAILRRYNLDIEEVREYKPGDTLSDDLSDETIANGILPFWKQFLAGCLAPMFRCVSIKSLRRHRSGRRSHYTHVIGQTVDVITVRELYIYLVATISRLAKENPACKDNAYKTAFCRGAAGRVLERLDARIEEQQANPDTRLPSVIPAVQAKVEHLKMHKTKAAPVQDQKGWVAGRQAGETIGIDPQID